MGPSLCMGMAPHPRQKRSRIRRRSGFVDETDAQRKYFARIVSLDEIRRVSDTLRTPGRSSALPCTPLRAIPLIALRDGSIAAGVKEDGRPKAPVVCFGSLDGGL